MPATSNARIQPQGQRPSSAGSAGHRRRSTLGGLNAKERAEAKHAAATDSFFSPADLVPSVLEAPTKISHGRGPHDASSHGPHAAGVHSPVRAPPPSGGRPPRPLSAAAACRRRRAADGGEDEVDGLSPVPSASSTTQPVVDEPTGHRPPMSGFAGGATVTRASSAIDALYEYAATTSDIRVVASAADLRRRQREAQRRGESAMIRAAVPQASCVTHRLTIGPASGVVPLTVGTGGATSLYERLGVAYVPKRTGNGGGGEGGSSNTRSPSASTSHRARGQRQQPRIIEARVVEHDRQRWGLIDEARDFFKPGLRRPLSAADRRKEPRRYVTTLEPGDTPLRFPVRTGPNIAPPGSRPASAKVRPSDVEAQIAARVAATSPQSPMQRSRPASAIAGMSAISHRSDGGGVSPDRSRGGRDGGSRQRLALADAQHEASVLLLAAEDAIRQAAAAAGVSQPSAQS